MQSWLSYTISIFFLLLALVAYPYLIAYRRILNSTLRCFRTKLISPEEFPDYLKTLLQSSLQELELHEFHLATYYQVPKADNQWYCNILAQHGSQHTYATLNMESLNQSKPLILVCTFFTDGFYLVTLNTSPSRIYSQNPKEFNQYMGDASTIADLWQTHQNKLIELSATRSPRNLTPEAFLATLEDNHKISIERLVETKEIYWVQPGETYRMSWWVALKCMVRTVFRMRKIGRHKQANPPSPLADPKVRDATIELEVAKFHQLQQKRQGLSNLTKMLVLVGSLLFFIASYSTILAPYKLVLFIITLLLHESGHIITMKLFGYRDTSLLFLPFLGALAIARKENSTLTEKVWVSLAGPLPGLILGLGLTIAFNLQTSYPEITQTASWRTDFVWLREFSLMLIGLNLFNLLPLYPLDGGQVVNLLLFSPNPYLGVLFKSIGLLFLSLLGLLQPMFLLFAILIALGIPNSFRMAKLSTALRKDMGAIPAGDCAERSAGGDRDSLIRLILARLQHPPDHSLPFGLKYALVVGLLESHRENKAQWPVRVVLSSVYFISLLGGIVGAVCAIIPPDILRSFSPDILRSFVNPKEYSKEYYQKRMKYEINQANQSLKQNPNNSDAYLRRARVRLYLKDIPGVIADTNRVIQLNPTSFMAYQLRGSARQQLGDWQGAQSDTKTARTLVLTQQIQSANRILRNHPQDIEAYLNRADAKLHLKDYQGAIADCNQVLRFNPKSSAALMTRAQVYLQKEDYTKALADANDSLQIKPIPSEAYYLRSQIRQKMGDKQGAISDTQKAYQIDQIEEATQDAQ